MRVGREIIYVKDLSIRILIDNITLINFLSHGPKDSTRHFVMTPGTQWHSSIFIDNCARYMI